ncbi:hypothetical protein D0Z07_6161 [Hyphodiscus hymeniophilus]|uniref:Xylanolytic transcriptional activator regulatory domain-containing protein n=1 Tax=Hyphodiscus hymeniophilus TaxID=353542 RepID=A0A9P6VFL6_9HELO|nr:hypothetical protein D0Z07_6161 [Hyphodiscus hymeniophilus]
MASPSSQHSRKTTASELEALSEQTLSDLCSTWFERYHPWFPILHKLSLLQETHNHATPLVDSPQSIVFKAIVAVTLPHWCLSNPLTGKQRSQYSAQYRNEVIMQAIGNLSLQSLQAILIITTIDYGAGKLSEFWNLVALCKRMATQLGLRELVISDCNDLNQLSTVSHRMLSPPTTLIEQEERIRAYWMTEVLDSMSSLGAGWNLGLSRPMEEAWFPCNETIWSFPEKAKAFSSFGDSEVSSAFSSFDTASANDRMRWQTQCISVDESLLKWRNSDDTTQTLSKTNVASDSTLVMISVTFDTAIISLYQRLALPPAGLGEVHGPWYFAIQRCLSACDDMSTIVRATSDANLENISPYMIFCIFVPRNLDLLVYGLKTCGQRWLFARRLEKVLAVAMAEKKMAIAQSSLPHQFYNLQYSSLDIDEALRVWSERPEIAIEE